MTHIHSYRPVQTLALAAVLTLLGGCKSSKVLNVTTPDILSPGVFNTPTGTDPLRFGVISDFTVGFDGSTDSFTTMAGDMADEMVASDTFAERLSVNSRSPIEVNSSTESVFRALQQAHSGAIKASHRPGRDAADAKVATWRDVHAARLHRDFSGRRDSARARRSRPPMTTAS